MSGEKSTGLKPGDIQAAIQVGEKVKELTRERFEHHLQMGDTPVHLLALTALCECPDVLKDPRDKLDAVVLMFSTRFSEPLLYDEKGVEQVLSFPDGKFKVKIPWEAVVGMSGRDKRIAPPVTGEEIKELMEKAKKRAKWGGVVGGEA